MEKKENTLKDLLVYTDGNRISIKWANTWWDGISVIGDVTIFAKDGITLKLHDYKTSIIAKLIGLKQEDYDGVIILGWNKGLDIKYYIKDKFLNEVLKRMEQGKKDKEKNEDYPF